jgi:hypothetical protein
LQGGSKNHREIELIFVRAKLIEQLKRLVYHPIGARAWAVYFVHHDDGFVPHRERFFGHKPRLRHRAFYGIDDQQHAIDHREYAFDLTAEIGVTRCVHHVDTRALPSDRAVFGENRDATLFFNVVGVHHALADFFMRGKRAGLFEQAIYKGGFSVVNVGDDGDITKCGGGHAKGLRRKGNPAL